LISQPYVRDDGAEIRLDVFDMGSSASAFGVFSHSRETVDRFVAPDVESEYASGLLTFWKGRYYVSILAYPETDEKRKVVQKLGRHIAAAIAGESKKPAILKRLPGQHLLHHTIRYFRHYIWLNSHFFISNENILNIDQRSEAVLAKYSLGAGEAKPVVLLLVSYPNHVDARAAYDGFLNKYLSGGEKGFKRMAKDGWVGSIQNGRLLAIVFNTISKQQSKDLLTKIKFAE